MDGTYSPLSYRYEDPTQNVLVCISIIQQLQPAWGAWSKTCSNSAAWSRAWVGGIYVESVLNIRLCGRRRIYFCSNFHASYCLFIRSKISPIIAIDSHRPAPLSFDNEGGEGGGEIRLIYLQDKKKKRVRHRRRRNKNTSLHGRGTAKAHQSTNFMKKAVLASCLLLHSMERGLASQSARLGERAPCDLKFS